MFHPYLATGVQGSPSFVGVDSHLCSAWLTPNSGLEGGSTGGGLTVWTQGKPRAGVLSHLDEGIRAWLEGPWIPVESVTAEAWNGPVSIP